MPRSVLLVDIELLKRELHLPDDVEIQAAKIEFKDPYHLRLFVSHPDIPEDAREVSATFQEHYRVDGLLERTTFEGWRKHA